jgi:hypothetical protein
MTNLQIRIGEISLMKDLSKTMDITMREQQEEEAAAEVPEDSAKKDHVEAGAAPPGAPGHAAAPPPGTEKPPPASVSSEFPPPHAKLATDSRTGVPAGVPSPSPSGTSTPYKTGIPIRQAITDKTEEDARLDAAGITEEENELRKRQQKKGVLSKEQREELAAYERERKRIRDERVDTLAKKLSDRISIWTETDMSIAVTKAFQGKIQLEVENLKMESFGLEILHAVGTIYIQKGSSFLKSQKFLGISGFFSRLKDKGNMAKETWNTISSAIDAQMTMEEMAKAEERGGEDWTDEKKAEYERRVTGKILSAAWRGSKLEIQSVLRDVCDRVLNDRHVGMPKRLERAQALILSGTIYQNASLSFLDIQLPIVHRPTYPTIYTDIPPSHRQNATPKKKETTWPLSNSWPTPPPKKKKAKTRTRTNPKTRNRVILSRVVVVVTTPAQQHE